MATISLCTTSTLLSQANEILDTHINLLPFSQNIVRLPCATEAHRMGYETGPLVPPEGTLVIDGVSIDTLLHRFERSKRFKDEGKVVLVKNGGKAWEGKALVHGDSDSDSRSIPIEDVYIVFQMDVHTPQPAESASNALAVLATTRASPNQFTILTAGRTVLEIQSHLRAIISQFSPKRLTGLSSDMMFKPFVHRQSLKVVVALGGLSECGKSTMGAAIDVMFGARGRREKFGSVLHLSSLARLPIDNLKLLATFSTTRQDKQASTSTPSRTQYRASSSSKKSRTTPKPISGSPSSPSSLYTASTPFVKLNAS